MSDEKRREKTRKRVRRHRRIKQEIQHEIAVYNQVNTSNPDDNVPVEQASSSSKTSPSIPGGPFRNLEEEHGNVLRNIECHEEPNSDVLISEADSIDNSDGEVNVIDNIGRGDGETDDEETDDVETDNVEDDDSGQANNERELEKLREWALESSIPQVHLDKLLGILRERLLPELPKSSKTFLKTNSMPYNILDIVDNDNRPAGQYVYFGIGSGLQRCINLTLHRYGIIELQINVDGLPVYSSSKVQFWPILCRVFTNPDVYKPFLVAIFCGESKPLCANLYLRKFVDEINQLTSDGIIICETHFTVRIQCFVCDTPARSFIKQVKGHGGYSACERCTIKGTRRFRRTVYEVVDCPERTDESFRLLEDTSHHNGRSVITEIVPPINMVTSFVLDFMHLCCIGVMKRLLIQHWLNGDLRVRLRPRHKIELSRRIESLRDQIPCEFQRKLRNLSHAAQWKATEYRFLLLYCGPVVLKKLLAENVYKHFLLLHVACRILCSEELSQTHNLRAKLFLRTFTTLLPRLYGGHSTVLNMHNLIHLADDAKNMRCSLSRISAFPFESFLGKLKKLVRTPNRPLAQLCRRIHEQSILSIERSLPEQRIKIIKKSNEQIDGIINIHKIKYEGFILSINSPDNIVLLIDKRVMKINKIFYPENSPNDIKFQGSVWNVRKEMFNYPVSSIQIDMLELVAEPSEGYTTLSLYEIERKMVKLSLKMFSDSGRMQIFVIPFLHEQL